MIRAIQVLGEGLGYRNWLEVAGHAPYDAVYLPWSGVVAKCHPPILATDEHEVISGVTAGMLICGIRWVEPYNGQTVGNPDQLPGPQRVLTEQEVRKLLEAMCMNMRPAVVDWTNRTISVLSETKTHPTKILSSGPMEYRDILFQIS